MSNPQNLIRPPVLSGPSTSNAPTNTPTMEQLTETIANIVRQIFHIEGKQLVQTALNPQSCFSKLTDQIIDPSNRQNLSELDKIPDVIRCLREFSGNPGEFNSWRKSVERILQIYEPLKGTPKYYGILNIIRNKIVGNADIALESYNTPLDWNAISRCLTMHYADKRDLGTLEYQMISLVQGNLSVQEFYQKVYAHMSLILNKIGCMDISKESLYLLTQTYRDKALDTFIRGLRGDLPRLLAMREPADLPQALHLCLKLENQNFRSNYAFNAQRIDRRSTNQPPPVQPRRFNTHFAQKPQPFYPHLAYTPRAPQNVSPWTPNNNFYNRQAIPPPRPSAPKPQPRPEPMDIDASLQSKRINYVNRPKPNDFVTKRPSPNPLPEPRKFQRNFNINHLDNVHSQEEYEYYRALATSNQEQEIPMEVPVNEYGNYDNAIEQLDISDIHFLD